MYEEKAARAIGWASIGIGLTELAVPKQLGNFMGVSNGQNTSVLRVLGIRELLHGVDIISHDDPTPGVWSRVAGDVLDAALLGAAAKKTRRPAGLATTIALVAGVAVLDIFFAQRLSQKPLRRTIGTTAREFGTTAREYGQKLISATRPRAWS